ncbi:F-box/kelch-repeat protein At3g23880-like [Chenopodium quinoa]|uniref:F-box/kelch-repeat protein At3g23880-like n=1 Tax=Chenopodium quinoa TaxID=63459 RepID=UPI000B791F19|nr:F-box/kelch-repeat protein At3g23880-like [Chenopodium quinoa]
MAENSAGSSKTLKNGERLLPSELKEEIFAKLPVKDILRSRSVCKPWKTLIDNQEFKKKLFEEAKRSNSKLIIWRKSFSSLEPTLQILCPPFNSVSPPIEINLSQFLDDSVFDDSDIMIVSSGGVVDNLDFKKFGVVDGIVCLGWNSFVVVWNPYTREFKRFNAPKKDWVFDLLEDSGINYDVFLNDQICAFGFDPIEQDYKFLIAHFTSALINDGNCKNKVLFQLYSVRNNAWRGAVFDFPFINGVVTGDGFMNDGKFYWFVKKCGEKMENGSFSPAVIAFDFCNEVFEVIKLPVELARGDDTIAVANRGVLEIILSYDDDRKEEGSRSEVWVMGDGGSWSRTLSVDLPCMVDRPIGVLKDGEIMFEKPSRVDGVKELVLIDPATDSCKKLGLDGTELWMFNYVQSLFSIKQ